LVPENEKSKMKPWKLVAIKWWNALEAIANGTYDGIKMAEIGGCYAVVFMQSTMGIFIVCVIGHTRIELNSFQVALF